MDIYRTETRKPIAQFIVDFERAAKPLRFLIHNKKTMAMSDIFKQHGVDVAENFDLHMIQVCKPEKAAASLEMNPERGSLMPKFIVVFTRAGRTQVRFLNYSSSAIIALLDDVDFSKSLTQSNADIIALIEEVC